jgi:hypothetical protein
MPFRFRRSMKIAPGVRLNITKTGVSARLGPRGAGLTVGTSGTTVSSGIPGTGLHTSQKLTKKASSARATESVPDAHSKAKGLGFFGWVGVLVIGFGLVLLIL